MTTAKDPARGFCGGGAEKNSIEAIQIGGEKIWLRITGRS